jgi:APA family basic amino acid/polyamine antiporter
LNAEQASFVLTKNQQAHTSAVNPPAGGELMPTLGWFSATTIVAGSMVGSGIFIVSADIARTVGTAGLLMAIWLFAAVLTILGAMSYGKLAAYMPKAGGQYVFLKESWGELPAFLYGWSLLTVIQTGFLAAVAVAFTKFLGVLIPAVSDRPVLFLPLHIGISPQQIFAVAVLFGLTIYNCTGIKNGAILQNVFTSLKVLALILLVVVGLAFGHHLWDGSIDWSLSLPPAQAAKGDLITLFAFASVGALFSADAWNYVTFIGGEVKDPRKNLPKALVWGTVTVVTLYLIANLAYLNLLPLSAMQAAPQDRVATAAMNTMFPGAGVMLMALIILISTFGCLNGMLLSGARVFYAMAKDNLMFRQFGEVHPRTHSPNFSMWAQFLWAALLALSGTYGKLLDYIVFSTLIFYIVTMLGLLRLGKRIPEQVNMTSRKDALIPIAYIIGASFIAFFLLFGDFFTPDYATRFAHDFYNTKFFTSIAGLGLTALGLPVYWIWKKTRPAAVS